MNEHRESSLRKALTITILEPDYSEATPACAVIGLLRAKKRSTEELKRFVSVDELTSFVLAAQTPVCLRHCVAWKSNVGGESGREVKLSRRILYSRIFACSTSQSCAMGLEMRNFTRMPFCFIIILGVDEQIVKDKTAGARSRHCDTWILSRCLFLIGWSRMLVIAAAQI